MTKATKVDLKYNCWDTAAHWGVDGPMVTKLKTYGELRAFAVSPRGEMSPDLRSLVESMAEKAAEF